MSTIRTTLSRFAAITAAVSMIVQGPILTAAEQSQSDRVQDVELRSGGMLTTRVVDLQGNPVVGQQVLIEHKGKQVASAVSDENGLVAITGLRPGLHGIVTPLGAPTACRFWAEGSAPPSAISLPAVVSDAEVIRGQFGAFNLPMVVYGAISIAAGVIAIDASRNANDAQNEADALARRVAALEAASP